MISMLFNQRWIVLFAVLLHRVSMKRWAHAAELVEKSIVHDNLTRWYLEYRPDSIVTSDRTPYPMVILFHGGTQSMREIMGRTSYGTNRWLTISDDNGFLLLVPNGVNLETGDTYGDDQNWIDVRNSGGAGLNISTYDDVDFVAQLIQQYVTNENFNVDPKRVYSVGSSNGGLMTYSLLLRTPELFAAGAAFIANLPASTSTTESIPYPNQTTPIMIMNGNKDRLMKWDGGILNSGPGGVVRSAHETRDFWIQANSASTADAIYTTLPNRNWFDRCRIRSEYYPPDINRNPLAAPVHFYEMDGSGHGVPSTRGFFNIRRNLYDLLLSGPSCHDVNGADIAWEFFMTHT
jgi:polyhydroxybutyrate depolymerase